MCLLTDFSVVKHRNAESEGMNFHSSWGLCRMLVITRKKRLSVKLEEGLVVTMNLTRL